MATKEGQSRILELEKQLVNIEAQLTQLKRQTEDLERQRKSVTQAIQIERVSNHISNRIPFEILGIIFPYVIKRDHSTLSKISLVSRAWYTAAVGHPHLWTSIQLRGPYHRHRLSGYRHYLELCYDRSGTLPLDVIFTTAEMHKAGEECLMYDTLIGADDSPKYPGQSCHHERPRCPHWRGQARTAVELLSDLFHCDTKRWRNFHFDWPCRVLLDLIQCKSFDWSLLNLITEGGESLESLYIGNSGHEFKTAVRLDHRLRNLKRLELVDQCWEIAAPYAQALPSVEELIMEWKDDIDWEQIAMRQLGNGWLRKFPRLQSLTLRSRSSIRPNSRQGDMVIEEYRSIKRLNLIGNVPPIVLRNIHFPNLKNLVLSPDEDDKYNLQYLASLSSLSLATATKSLEIRSQESGFKYYQELHALLDHLQELEEVIIAPNIWSDLAEWACVLNEETSEVIEKNHAVKFVGDIAVAKFRTLVQAEAQSAILT